jgi:hypothetical protein
MVDSVLRLGIVQVLLLAVAGNDSRQRNKVRKAK